MTEIEPNYHPSKTNWKLLGPLLVILFLVLISFVGTLSVNQQKTLQSRAEEDTSFNNVAPTEMIYGTGAVEYTSEQMLEVFVPWLEYMQNHPNAKPNELPADISIFDKTLDSYLQSNPTLYSETIRDYFSKNPDKYEIALEKAKEIKRFTSFSSADNQSQDTPFSPESNLRIQVDNVNIDPLAFMNVVPPEYSFAYTITGGNTRRFVVTHPNNPIPFERSIYEDTIIHCATWWQIGSIEAWHRCSNPYGPLRKEGPILTSCLPWRVNQIGLHNECPLINLTPTLPITTGTQCQIGQQCSNCNGDPGRCYPDCNGGWCNGGQCSTCQPENTPAPRPTNTPTPSPTRTPTPTPPTYRVAGRVLNIGLSPTPVQCNNVNIGTGVNGRAVILHPTTVPGQPIYAYTTNYQGADGAFIFDGILNGSYALCHGTANIGPYACTYPQLIPNTNCMSISVQGASQSGIRFIHSSTVPTPTPTRTPTPTGSPTTDSPKSGFFDVFLNFFRR